MAYSSDQSETYSALSVRHQSKYGIDFISPYLAKGQRVLDLGCGTGNLTILIHEAVHPGSILGVDPDTERIKTAKERYCQYPEINFINCKGSEIPAEGNEGQFDLGVANVVFHWMDIAEKKKSLDRVFRLLKPGALFLVQLCPIIPPNMIAMAAFIGPEEVEAQKSMFHCPTVEEFTELSREAGFDVCSSKYYVHTTEWKDLESVCKFYYGILHGVVDFMKAVEITKRDYGGKCPITWENGKEFFHTTHLQRFVLKRN